MSLADLTALMSKVGKSTPTWCRAGTSGCLYSFALSKARPASRGQICVCRRFQMEPELIVTRKIMCVEKSTGYHDLQSATSPLHWRCIPNAIGSCRKSYWWTWLSRS